jgi:hypothetical protein
MTCGKTTPQSGQTLLGIGKLLYGLYALAVFYQYCAFGIEGKTAVLQTIAYKMTVAKIASLAMQSRIFVGLYSS